MISRKGKLIYADSVTNSDLLYATGFHAHDPFAYFSSAGQKAVVLSALEIGRARSELKKNVNALEIKELIGDSDVPDRVNATLGAIVERYPADVWEVPADFPVYRADFLRSLGVTLKPVNGMFFPRRQRKSQLEVKHIRAALRIAESAMGVAENILREAKINNEQQLIWHGAVLTSKILRTQINTRIVGLEAVAESTIAACGRHSAEPHNVGHGPIWANQPIVIDIFPRAQHTGYWGDMTRTYVKGKATPTVMKAYHAVKDARDKAKSLIRPGVIPAELNKMVLEILKHRGFDTFRRDGVYRGFFHGLGHGVGLDIHELPRVAANVTEPLKTGDVITVEPGAYYPEWGGIRLEDMGLVTRDGFDCFNAFHDVLELP